MKTKSNSMKKMMILIVAIIALACISAVSVYAYHQQPEVRFQKALDLGEQYLSELEYEKAISYYEEAIKIEPSEVQPYHGIIEAYTQMGMYQEAVELYHEAIGRISDDGIKLLQEDLLAVLRKGAEASVENKDYDNAIYCYGQMLAVDLSLLDVREKLSDIYLILAEESINNKAYHDAIEYYETIFELIPGHTAATEKLFEVYLIIAENEKVSRNYEQAVEYCDKVLSANPEHVDATKKLYEIFLLIADELVNNENYQEAIEYYNMILAHEPDNVKVKEQLTKIYLVMAVNAVNAGDYKLAKEYYNKVLLYDTDNPDALAGIHNLEELEKVLVYEAGLRTVVKKLTSGEVYDFSDPFIYSDEFIDMTNTLSAPVFLAAEDGKYIGIYTDGYIYYGEVENGIRSGEGYWFFVGKRTSKIVKCMWVNDAPNGDSITSTYDNGYDYYTTVEVELVNGIYEGECIYTVYEEGSISHQWIYNCSNGKAVIIPNVSQFYNNIIAVCISCQGMLDHYLSTNGEVNSIPY